MSLTTSWKRLATIGAATAVVAGMSPFIGVVAAGAGPVSSGHVDLLDPPSLSSISGGSNGTDNLQHLYADVTQAAGANPQIAFVRFTYTDQTTSGPETTIATAPVNPKPAGADLDTPTPGDSFAVSSWSVPANTDVYKVTAHGLEANQATIVASDTSTVTDNTGALGVAVSRPNNNSLVGYYAKTGLLNVAGTSSAPGTGVTVADRPTGDMSPALTTSTATYDQTTTHWAADIVIAGGETPTAGVNKSLTGVEALTAPDTELQPGTAYLQAFASSPNGFTMSPTSGFGCQAASASPSDPPTPADCANTTSSNPFQVYTLQSTDQHGNPISGLPVDLTLTDPNDNGSARLQFRSTSGPPVWTTQAFTSGMPVLAPSTGDYGTSGGQLVTNVFGQITFRLSNTDAEVVGINAKTKFSGSFVNGTDYNINGQYSTTAQVPTSGTATIVGHPTAPLYATQEYGLGTARLGPTPGIQVNVKDASNNNIQGATVQYSYVRHITSGNNVAGCVDPNHYPVTVPADPGSTALNSDPSDANGNTFITPDAVDAGHTPYLQAANSRCTETEVGNDVFNVYIDKNGVPGYQAGGDALLGSDTLSFGPESVYFKPCDQATTYVGGNDPYANASYQFCDTQQKAGTDLTLTVFASIWDGTTRQPVANRAIDIMIPAPDTGSQMVFSPNGNSGLVLVNDHEGSITTNGSGLGTVTVADPAAGDEENVKASDPSLTNAIQSDDGADHVLWRTFSPSLNSVDTLDNFFFTGEVTPLASVSQLVGSPGQPLIEGFRLRDQGGHILASVPVTLTTTAGFFTDLPNIYTHDAGANAQTYSLLHFDGADSTPVDGATISGNLHSNGTTETVVSGNSGELFFALGVKGDPGFAQNGQLLGDVTVQVGGAGTTLTLPDDNGESAAAHGLAHQVLFSTDNLIEQDVPDCSQGCNGAGSLYSYGHVAALNPASSNPLSLVAGLFDNNGRYHTIGIAPSSDKATTSTNTIPVDTVDATSTQLDGFGNPVSELIDVSTSGVNGPDSGPYFGAYKWVNNATAASLGFHHDDGEFCPANSSAASAGACPEIAGVGDTYVNQLTNPASNVPLVGAETLTADWNANHTAWLVNSTTHAVSINVTDSPDPTKSYTVNWYDREASGFKYQTSSTPSGSKHHAGTPVTTTVQVLDSKNRPVNDLGVQFIRSGPNGETQDTGNPFTCDSCPNVQFTNVGGRAGFTFTSHAVGKYTVTAIVTDGSGNEVGRATSSGTLTQPVVKVTIHGKHRVSKGSHHKLHGSAPANHTVKIFRGGKKIATVHANATGKWFKKLKFKKSHVYYVVSGGATSADLHVVVHKKHHK